MNIEFGVTTIVRNGNNIEVIATFPDNSVDSIVTDPPYELGFMGKSWDSSGIAYNVELWQECLRVLKPGGHLLAFGGSRTYHRMACAIEDAGFQIRDQIMWVYGSGFPKSLNIGKAIDKVAGVEREVIGVRTDGMSATAMKPDKGWNANSMGSVLEITAPATAEAKEWDGWGTALKPAHEPIVMARKPLDGTVANNVLTHGVGGINIDGCRVEAQDSFGGGTKGTSGFAGGYENDGWVAGSLLGRWPANFIHDGSDEVTELFPDSGSASRFFYCAKAGKAERNAGLDGMPEKRPDDRTTTGMGTFEEKGVAKQANHHPTVKPTTLMRYLVRLVTPPNGIVLDPFAGSGSTLVAATLEGFSSIGIEITEEYIPIIEARIEWAKNNVNQQMELDL